MNFRTAPSGSAAAGFSLRFTGEDIWATDHF